MKEHFGKDKKAAKYTKSHSPQKIAAVWRCSSRSDAMRLEYRIKKLTKSQKEKLITDNETTPLSKQLDITRYQRITRLTLNFINPTDGEPI